MKIYVVPGVDARAAARDLLKTGAVGIDDIGGMVHDAVRHEILDELGHVADDMDLRTQRVDTAIGPIFVFRNHAIWSAAKARITVLRLRGRP